MKKFLTILFPVILLTSCTGSVPGAGTIDPNRLNVAATFYPLAFFASEIGGDVAAVHQIVPGGVEPHDYEPSTNDLQTIYQSRVFIYNGAGVDAWAEKIHTDVAAKNIAVVRAVDTINVINTTAPDPHVWLSPVLAKQEVMAIRDAMMTADTTHAETYRANADLLLEQLDDLDAQFRTGLTNCRQHRIVVSHDAFEYLAKEYGFSITFIAGLSPDAEPSPKTLTEITKTIQNEGIKYIFMETLMSPKLAYTVAAETGAKTLMLNPLEGLTKNELDQGDTYVSVMRQNFQNIRTALECQ